MKFYVRLGAGDIDESTSQTTQNKIESENNADPDSEDPQGLNGLVRDHPICERCF